MVTLRIMVSTPLDRFSILIATSNFSSFQNLPLKFFLKNGTVVEETGGHFACACVNPLNDNIVGASNLMAGNRKLARKVTVLLKAISLVL